MDIVFTKALCSDRKYSPERRHCSGRLTHSSPCLLLVVSPGTSHPIPQDDSDVISTTESVPSWYPEECQELLTMERKIRVVRNSAAESGVWI